MADPSHFWIGLRLIGDKTTVTSSIDFHFGVSRVSDSGHFVVFEECTGPSANVTHQPFRCILPAIVSEFGAFDPTLARSIILELANKLCAAAF
jgi:hypothetical protein